MSLDDKHLEHLAAMQAINDFSWHSWNSPVGLSIFFLVGAASLAVLAWAFYILRLALLIH
jgi:hypothetical protein